MLNIKGSQFIRVSAVNLSTFSVSFAPTLRFSFQANIKLPESFELSLKMTSTVTFQNNVINANAIVGGYGSWALVPNGARVAPANQTTPNGVTLPATTFNAYKPDGNFDLYQPESSVDYAANEVVVLTGQCRKYNDH